MRIQSPSTLESTAIQWLTVDQWQAYVECHRHSSIFHHRNWIELLNSQYGFQIRIPALVVNGKIQAAIPLLQTRSLRGQRKLISLPFTDYLPVLAEDPQALVALCQMIADSFRGKFETIVLRSNATISGLNYEVPNVLHELETNRPLDQIEANFHRTIRRNLRKAERDQLGFEKRSDRDAVKLFYRLHVLTRKKLGVPVQPKSYFNRLAEKLIDSGLGFVAVVSKQDVPIAAGIMLGFNGRLTYKYAASNPAALEHRPNDWLVYNTIRVAALENYDVFDFGITDKNQDGLRRFKSKWGAVESDVAYNYILGRPDANPGPSRAVRLAGEVIKRSPTAVCRALGQAFYKYSQ